MAERYDKYTVLVIVMLVIFLVGFVLDFIEITFIHVPVLVPILIEDFGFNALYICVLLAVNLQTSFMTPPFGYNLFLMRAMAPPEITLRDIYSSILPFVLVMVLALALVMAFPEIALWLPGYVYGY